MNKGLIIFSSLLVLNVSCAHRSGNIPYNEGKTASSEVAKDQSKTAIQINNNNSQPNNSENKVALSGSEIFKRYNSAVFLVVTTDGQMSAQGSGFFINDNGVAVSNYHVFEGTTIGAEMIKLANNDKVYKVCDIYVKDQKHDFILFRVDCNKTNYLNIANTKPQVGDKVYAIGSPLGLENTFSSGEVSQWRSNDVIQTNVQIDHGSSGGALINEYGEVVGITSGTFAEGSQANLNYAWSIDVIKPYIK
jgi:serine protease Do